MVSEINNINTSISNYNSQDGCCNDIYCEFSDPLYEVKTTYNWPGENTNDISGTSIYIDDNSLPGLVYQWQNEMSCFIKQQLHCNQLIGASYAGYQGSAINGNKNGVTFSPDLTYFSGCIDYVSWNDYSASFKRYENNTKQIGRLYKDNSGPPLFGSNDLHKNLPNFNKPIFNSEFGHSYAEGCDSDIEYYRGVWKGSFTIVAGSPMEWGSQYNKNYLFNTYGVLNDFMSGIDLRGDWDLNYDKAKNNDSLNKVEILYYRNSENGASKAFGIVDNLTINMKSMSTGGECYKGEYIHSIPEQVVAGGNGQVLYLRKMGSLKNYKINYYSIITGDLVYTTSVHQSDINGRLFVEHPILFQSSTEFMYAFKAYRVNDGSFMASAPPQIINNYLVQKITPNTDYLENDTVYKVQNSRIETIINNNQLIVNVYSDLYYSSVDIYSLDGKFVLKSSLVENQKTIDLSELSKGIYIIKSNNISNVVLTSKIVYL